MARVSTKSLITWLDSLPEKEVESILSLYTKQLVKKKEPLVKKARPKLLQRQPSNKVHPDIQAVQDEIEGFKQLHAEVMQEYQRLEDTLQSTRARIMARWKEY